MVYIAKSIAKELQYVKLGILEYEAEIRESDNEINNLLNEKMSELSNMKMEDIRKINAVEDTRAAYKLLGNNPSKYRNAAEAMLRRIIKQKGLYQINNIVDINNYMSISSGYTVGSYMLENIDGDVCLDVQKEDAYYDGIGKEKVNYSKMPVLFDGKGAFGSTTSDSQRTMVKMGNHKIISVIYCFSNTELNAVIQEYKKLLVQFAGIHDEEIYEYIVEK